MRRAGTRGSKGLREVGRDRKARSFRGCGEGHAGPGPRTRYPLCRGLRLRGRVPVGLLRLFQTRIQGAWRKTASGQTFHVETRGSPNKTYPEQGRLDGTRKQLDFAGTFANILSRDPLGRSASPNSDGDRLTRATLEWHKALLSVGEEQLEKRAQWREGLPQPSDARPKR
jgi:hypothetical protein